MTTTFPVAAALNNVYGGWNTTAPRLIFGSGSREYFERTSYHSLSHHRTLWQATHGGKRQSEPKGPTRKQERISSLACSAMGSTAPT